MSGRKQGRATLALLGLIAAGVVVALAAGLGLDPRGILAPPPSPGGEAPPAAAPPPAPGGSPSPPPPRTAEASKPDPAPAAPAALSSTPPAAPPQQTPSAPEPSSPSFDVVRVEPTGESVIAGRGAPGATIEMLRDGQVHARTAADQSGLFAFVPPALTPGSHQVSLQSIAPDGTRQRSRDTVTIVVSDDRSTRPLVALTAPDKPTVLLSNPEAPEPKNAQNQNAQNQNAQNQNAQNQTAQAQTAQGQTNQAQPAAPTSQPQQQAAVQPSAPAAAPQAQPSQGSTPQAAQSSAPQQPAPPRPEVKIVTVEAEESGRLYVSGQAAPGSTVRLYLNETFIAPGGVGADGRVSFAIGRGVRPGDYRVRIDDVDPVSGSVKSRAEVAFNVPVPGPGQPPSSASTGPQIAAAPPAATRPAPQPPSSPATATPGGTPQPPSGSVATATSGGTPQPPSGSATAPPGGTSARPTPPAAAAPDRPPVPPTPGTGPAPSVASAAPPASGATAGTPAVEGGSRASGAQVASAAPSELRDLPPGTVVIPDINTAIVSRGDNLWRISQRIYGKGVRYTVIYGANQAQIRNPNRIYPGQVFVLPDGEAPKNP